MRVLAAVFFAVAVALLAQEAPQKPVRLSSGVLAGQIVSKVMPVFPQEAIAAHVNGSVVMHVILNGEPVEVDSTITMNPNCGG